MHRIVNGQLLAIAWYLLFVATLTACGISSTPGNRPSLVPSLPGLPSQQPLLGSPVPKSTESASPDSLLPSQWRTYRNEEFNYSIDVAPNWEVDDSAMNEVIIFIGQSNGVAGLHVLALDWFGTLEEFTQQNYDFHRRRAKVMFELGTRDQVRLASGQPAERIEFRVLNDTRFCTESLVDVLVMSGGRGYVLQGSVCEGAEHTYGRMIEAMQRSFNLELSSVMAPDWNLDPDNPPVQN